MWTPNRITLHTRTVNEFVICYLSERHVPRPPVTSRQTSTGLNRVHFSGIHFAQYIDVNTKAVIVFVPSALVHSPCSYNTTVTHVNVIWHRVNGNLTVVQQFVQNSKQGVTIVDQGSWRHITPQWVKYGIYCHSMCQLAYVDRINCFKIEKEHYKFLIGLFFKQVYFPSNTLE